MVGVADALGGAVLGQQSRLRDELLSGEVFAALTEARRLTEDWRIGYTTEPAAVGTGDHDPGSTVG